MIPWRRLYGRLRGTLEKLRRVSVEKEKLSQHRHLREFLRYATDPVASSQTVFLCGPPSLFCLPFFAVLLFLVLLRLRQLLPSSLLLSLFPSRKTAVSGFAPWLASRRVGGKSHGVAAGFPGAPERVPGVTCPVLPSSPHLQEGTPQLRTLSPLCASWKLLPSPFLSPRNANFCAQMQRLPRRTSPSPLSPHHLGDLVDCHPMPTPLHHSRSPSAPNFLPSHPTVPGVRPGNLLVALTGELKTSLHALEGVKVTSWRGTGTAGDDSYGCIRRGECREILDEMRSSLRPRNIPENVEGGHDTLADSRSPIKEYHLPQECGTTAHVRTFAHLLRHGERHRALIFVGVYLYMHAS